MKYFETKEKARSYSVAAMERMESEGLPPTPTIYETWYAYYCGTVPELVRAIDILISQEKNITEDLCHELYVRFLHDGMEEEEVKKAGDKIQKTISDVTGAVSTVKDATTSYNQSLSSATESLSADTSKDEFELVLNAIVSETKEMLAQNEYLEDELTKSTEVMKELKRNLEIVRREAYTDSLTGIANRKAFETEIIRIAQESDEAEKVFSLLLMDIDHFKSFNDNFGHQVGDQVLKLVSKTLIDGVKGRDLASRYGGEEFAIILPETGMKEAIGLAEQLRRAVETKEVINRNTGESMGRITISGGVAEYKKGEDLEDLISRADYALYTAKHNGRNQIASSTKTTMKDRAQA